MWLLLYRPLPFSDEIEYKNNSNREKCDTMVSGGLTKQEPNRIMSNLPQPTKLIMCPNCLEVALFDDYWWHEYKCLPPGYKRKQKKAWRAVAKARERGEIKPPENCDLCPKRAALKAHHDNYDEPLKVLWLCQGCHSQRHKFGGRLVKATRYQ